MKNWLLSLSVLVFPLLFCSCSDEFLEDVIDVVSGNAETTIEGEGDDEYTSSIVMFNESGTSPCAIGLSTTIDIDDLMNMGDVSSVPFPFMCYRVVGNNLSSGDHFTVNNVLTEEDLVDFDYESLLNGKFANNHIVGVAVDTTKFYVMSTGTINLSKVTKTKVLGSFSGKAYVINLNASPMLSEELVDFSGEFKSRAIPMMGWLLNLQEEALADNK